MAKGPLLILSGPSGSGKSTLVQRLLGEGGLPVRKSVSVTTRAPRPGEVDGIDYYYWTPEKFRDEVRAGAFLEWAEVHGNYYGTLRREVEEPRMCGVGVILVIDVQGAALVRPQVLDCFSVFVRPSTWELLEQRLRGRGTENESALAVRLENARQELARAGEYDYQLINDDLDRAVAEFRGLIRGLFVKGPSCSTS